MGLDGHSDAPAAAEAGSDSPSVIGAASAFDPHSLDEETQRFVYETHLENIGLVDFLGFDLAALSVQISDGGGKAPVTKVRSRSGRNQLGETGALITTFKSFCGMGILTMPYATVKGGYVLGPLTLVLVALLSLHCMMMLVNMSTKLHGVKTPSFGAVGEYVFGRVAKAVVDNCLIATQYGFAVATLLFIVQNVGDIVCLETRGVACPAKAWLIIVLLTAELPVCWLSSLQVLALPLLMANVILIFGISWVFYSDLVQIGADGAVNGVVAFNWAELPIFFGCAVFAFEGIGMILPIMHSMQEPARFPVVLRQAVGTYTVLSAFFGFMGYLAWGPETRDIVFASLPPSRMLSFLRLFYCLGIFFGYPICIFPVFQILEHGIQCLKASDAVWRRRCFRTVIVASTGIVGSVIPHFGLFLGLIGSIACSLLAFVFPALFHLKRPDKPAEGSRWVDVKDVAIILFGLIAGTYSFVVTLQSFFSAETEES